MEKSWDIFTADYDYEKELYQVLLPDGTILENCWPNAGMMHCSDTGKIFKHTDNIKVRIKGE